MSSVTTTFHLKLHAAALQGATLALLPGDPARVSKIAGLLQNPEPLSCHREFTSWSAEIAGHKLIVCSTGIGGPSTSIAVEELAQLGIRTFLRVGTTGAIQADIQPGDLIITTASVRLDGASAHFAPLSYPAVADFAVTSALHRAASHQGCRFHTGISVSSDTFYPGQERYDTYKGEMLDSLRGSLKQWQRLGALNFEMESATLFTQCATQGLRAGMVSGVLVNRCQQEIPDELLISRTEEHTIRVAIAAARALLDGDPSGRC